MKTERIDSAFECVGENPAISILPHLSGMGGPVSFYHRLVSGLSQQGVSIVDSPEDERCRAILVIGGTRRLDLLWKARRRGVRVVQRLNGMNWLHRKRPLGWRYYLRAELSNFLLATIRRHFADRIVYQSDFARSWWQTVYHTTPVQSKVAHNGVELDRFTPQGPEKPPEDHIRLLLVEAHVGGGYEKGIENAIGLAQMLAENQAQAVEVVIVGDVPDALRAACEVNSGVRLSWHGKVSLAEIPAIDRSAHLMFSSDLNAACPNSVIEALACGLPVIGYATGSLPELVSGDAGRVVPYGSNYWNLEQPDVSGLVGAALEILSDQPRFRLAARKQAEAFFGMQKMVDAYADALLGD